MQTQYCIYILHNFDEVYEIARDIMLFFTYGIRHEKRRLKNITRSEATRREINTQALPRKVRVIVKLPPSASVEDPDHFDADPDPLLTSMRIRIRIQHWCGSGFLFSLWWGSGIQIQFFTLMQIRIRLFHFDADPDTTFHFDADPNPDPAPHQCDATCDYWSTDPPRLHLPSLKFHGVGDCRVLNPGLLQRFHWQSGTLSLF
jgi:hypothetical protein